MPTEETKVKQKTDPNRLYVEDIEEPSRLLEHLTEQDIAELAANDDPPEVVRDVLVAVITLLGKGKPDPGRPANDEWMNCKQHLGDPSFLDTFKALDKKGINDIITKPNVIYARPLLHKHTWRAIRTQPSAAWRLFKWGHAVLLGVYLPRETEIKNKDSVLISLLSIKDYKPL